MSFAAILVCAGSGLRMGTPGDKLMLDLGGRPVAAWSLDAVLAARPDRVVAVVSERNLEVIAGLIESQAEGFEVHVVLGGARRQDSVRAGLEYLGADPPELVAIHDGARPLATPELFALVLDAAREHGAAIPGLALKDSVKEVDGQGSVRRSLDRGALVGVQTPQAFRFELLQRAHREGAAQGLVVDDDAELVERLGAPVRVVEGDPRNLKVTTPDDVVLLRAQIAEGPA